MVGQMTLDNNKKKKVKHSGSRGDGVNREVANTLFRQKPQTLTHSPIEVKGGSTAAE